jgi:hypothetical protein
MTTFLKKYVYKTVPDLYFGQNHSLNRLISRGEFVIDTEQIVETARYRSHVRILAGRKSL